MTYTFKPKTLQIYLLGVIKRADHFLISFTPREKLQGFAVEAPSGGWCITFALGRLGNLTFLYKKQAGYPGFPNLRALSSLQFFLIRAQP